MNWTGQDLPNQIPTADLLAQLEAAWRECIADEGRADYIIVPLSWFNTPRRVIRWRGKRMVISSRIGTWERETKKFWHGEPVDATVTKANR